MKITSNSTKSNPVLLNSAPTKSFLDAKIFLLGLAILGGLIYYLYFTSRPSNQLKNKNIKKEPPKNTDNEISNPSSKIVNPGEDFKNKIVSGLKKNLQPPSKTVKKPLPQKRVDSGNHPQTPSPSKNSPNDKLTNSPKKTLEKTEKFYNENKSLSLKSPGNLSPRSNIPQPSDKSSPSILPKKKEVLEAYKKDPSQCSKNNKTMIFLEIDSIESKPESNSITSFVGLMQYMHPSKMIDLRVPLCSSLVLDTLALCTVTVVEELCAWLKKQETLSLVLLNQCFEVFSKLNENYYPFRIESILSLIESYKNLSKEENFSPEFLFAVKILIEREPNNDKVMSVVAWMMKQKKRFTDRIFLDLAGIIQKKENEKQTEYPRLNLEYPLLIQMINDFKEIKGSDKAITTLWEKNQNHFVAIFLLRKDSEIK